MSLKELIVGLGEDIWVLEHLNEEQAKYLTDNAGDIPPLRARAAYALSAMGLDKKTSHEFFVGSLKSIIDSMIDKEADKQPTS